MGYAEEMCDIVREHAGENVRYFVRAHSETREQDVLFVRDDLAWTEQQEQAVDDSILTFLERGAFEDQMGAENVNQVIKVADDRVLFTGFVGDEIIVVSFERGILQSLPPMVADFREYLEAHDVDFIAL